MAALAPAVFATIVEHTPLVSIDLLVRDAEDRLLVGKRRNRPAQGTWFVPGGRVAKDERLAAAFERLTAVELGTRLPFSRGRFAGVFEHFYPDNALGAPGFGTHYVVLAYGFVMEHPLHLPGAQHSEYRWLTDEEALADPGVHDNTKAYCRNRQ